VDPKKLIVELSPEDIRAAIKTFSPTDISYDTRHANISPLFTYALEKGWIRENPFRSPVLKKTVRRRVKKLSRSEKHSRTGKLRAKIDYLTPEEVTAAFSACSDHRADQSIRKEIRVDCSDCAAPLALMIFAGIRPDQKDGEILYLRWEDIIMHSNQIIVPEFAAKDGRQRVVKMSPNLKAWLQAVPEGLREGPIVPHNWERKLKAIRKIAIVKDGSKRHDVTRHTYATMQRASGMGYVELADQMGNSEAIVRRHYDANIADKGEAARFWSITPDGTGATLRATA
jgi:integrase